MAPRARARPFISPILRATPSSSRGRPGRPSPHRPKKLKDNPMQDPEMMAKMKDGKGFIAALDQSGGSTPKALKGYGLEEGAWSTAEEMFRLIHQMRSRIVTSPVFNGDKVIGGCQSERTIDVKNDGNPQRKR